MNDKRYIQFPLMMLRDVHIDYEKAMQDIAGHGTVNWAIKQVITDHDAARQLIYMFYRDEDIEPEYYDLIENTIDVDKDYNGFAGDTFEPEGIDEVIELFNGNTELKEYALHHCRLQKINNFFNITGRTNNQRFVRYEEINNLIQDHETSYGTDPRPTIDISLFWDFVKNPDPDLFAAYIAIRSLQGQKNYIATTRNVILMRMIGAKSNEVLKDYLQDETISGLYNKYNRSAKALRYNFDKLFSKLLSRGLLRAKVFDREVSSRKIFLSTTIDYDELSDRMIEYAQKRQHKKNEQKAKDRIRATI